LITNGITIDVTGRIDQKLRDQQP